MFLPAPANAHDTWFHLLIQHFQDRTVSLANPGFHARLGNSSNPKCCPRGAWNDRMLIETVLSMLILISHFKKIRHRGIDCLLARLAFTVAAFNPFILWDGLQPDPNGFIPLSTAQFSL